PDLKGRALSVLLGGITVATIAGVPSGALLGELLGWRATFWAVALLCLPAALGVLRGLPATEPHAATGPMLRAQLAELRRPRLVLVMGLGALVNAATCGAFTYIAPVVTETAGFGSLWALGAGTLGPVWAGAVLVAAALLLTVPGRHVFTGAPKEPVLGKAAVLLAGTKKAARRRTEAAEIASR
ncbi:MAG TPA: MFS transporter, partial [Glycomyces sp.]|nr:MFS transporter [Glycomyces sp.]